MRLHHLRVTAFGPFADTVEIDLDRLSEAGLFLLTGPTGAGKTSVLDAVCFALYGQVPGDRNAAKRLRSDHAAPGARPEVTLEATLAGRRFRLVRSPAWERPKRRGTGTTPEQASVSLSELVDGAWTTLSTRLDEAGQLVTGLVGMNAGQFTQVAMLPQGRFQAFLRASSAERQKLLQELFRTGRFDRVEKWLVEERTTLRRRSEAVHDEVADRVSRLSEAAATALPGGWDLHDLGPEADAGTLLPWAVALRTTAAERLGAATTRVAEHAATEQDARTALEEARTAAEQGGRRAAALAEEARLAAAAPAREADRQSREAARRAAPVVVLADVERRASAALAAAEAEAGAAVARALAHLRQAPGEDHVDAVLESGLVDVGHALAGLRPLEQRAARLAAASARFGDLGRERRDLLERTQDLAAEAEDLPVRRVAAQESVAEAERAAVVLESAEKSLAELRERQRARVAAAGLVEEHEAAHARWLGAREAVQSARERLLEVREERVSTMAAELAVGLAVGSSCPVCGSCEHPHKAVRPHGVADAVAEKAAQRALDDRNGEEAGVAEHVRNLASRRDRALALAGDLDAETLATRVVEAQEQVAAARAGSAALAAARERLETLETRLEAVRAEGATVREQLAAATSERQSCSREIADLEGELAVGLTTAERVLEGRTPQPEDGVLDLALPFDEPDQDDAGPAEAARLRRLTRDLEARRSGLESARSARARLVRERAACATAQEDLARALAEHAFEDAEQAREAALPEAECQAIDERLAAHATSRGRVAEVLADVGREGANVPGPEALAGLAAAHREQHRLLEEARVASQRATQQCGRLTELVGLLEERLDAWAPVRAEHALVSRVAAFAEGKSADNALRMRLSAFVLAYRLSQVVTAANARLGAMTDHRFALEHTGERGAGETRGGLSLLVRDDWSGEARDPATLSGGETFVVSLALALGLADVITAEAGGTSLETLFVDEGFGSLDAETLEDVLGILDSLREGGRVVGVVSHVTEMRDRIPARLAVHKTRTGSAVELQGV
ncbi:AAA family ATPase [Nocardioides bruguierae]|uniref:AAA family ATPase n=1 Tax=Nocardioides bruguierae TaxID=2945102 RepID=UPI0020223F44|nr:SMC family ATPase [Nocardioides bruguierae]MCL8025947.1 SMC family ATPase [Nocardioides bruguierae]